MHFKEQTYVKKIDLWGNKLSNFNNDIDNTSQCLDFKRFDKMKQLQSLELKFNRIACIVTLESIRQHTHNYKFCV